MYGRISTAGSGRESGRRQDRCALRRRGRRPSPKRQRARVMINGLDARMWRCQHGTVVTIDLSKISLRSRTIDGIRVDAERRISAKHPVYAEVLVVDITTAGPTASGLLTYLFYWFCILVYIRFTVILYYFSRRPA